MREVEEVGVDRDKRTGALDIASLVFVSQMIT
jgi:hypothetical protein